MKVLLLLLFETIKFGGVPGEFAYNTGQKPKCGHANNETAEQDCQDRDGDFC
jgi:hypothetical protein